MIFIFLVHHLPSYRFVSIPSMEKHTSIKSGPNFKIEIFAMFSHLKTPEISISNACNGHKLLSRHHSYAFQPQFWPWWAYWDDLNITLTSNWNKNKWEGYSLTKCNNRIMFLSSIKSHIWWKSVIYMILSTVMHRLSVLWPWWGYGLMTNQGDKWTMVFGGM